MKKRNRSKGYLTAFIIQLICAIIVIIDSAISIAKGTFGFYQWFSQSALVLCLIGFSCYYFAQYKKAKATESAQDK